MQRNNETKLSLTHLTGTSFYELPLAIMSTSIPVNSRSRGWTIVGLSIGLRLPCHLKCEASGENLVKCD